VVVAAASPLVPLSAGACSFPQAVKEKSNAVAKIAEIIFFVFVIVKTLSEIKFPFYVYVYNKKEAVIDRPPRIYRSP